MSRSKVYNGTEWIYQNTLVSPGGTGGANVIISDTAPSDHTAIWIDTNEQQNATIPISSVIGLQALLNKMMFPQIIVTAPIGTVITVTDGTTTYTVTATTTSTTVTTNAYGTWTVTMESSGTKIKTITIDAVKQYKCNWGLVPAGYTDVEYIEASGKAYIDSGVAREGLDLSIDMDLAILKSNGFVCFAGDGGTRGKGAGLNLENNAYSLLEPYVSTHTFGTVTNDRQNIIISFSENTETASGDISSSVTSSNFGTSADWNSTSFPIGDSYGSSGSIKFYSAKIYKDNTLVRNFIPAIRDADNVPGFYDTESDVFYTNQGTGEFIIPTT